MPIRGAGPGWTLRIGSLVLVGVDHLGAFKDLFGNHNRQLLNRFSNDGTPGRGRTQHCGDDARGRRRMCGPQ